MGRRKAVPAEAKEGVSKVEKEMPTEIIMEPDHALLQGDAEAWARECGFSGELRIDGPHVEKYPRFGYGYTLMIRELSGKQRMATARYRSDNMRSYWSVDGIVTG